jgi:hypothetical protein
MGQLIHNVRGVAERVCNEIEGWLNFTTAVVTVEILNNQYQCGVKGGVLEFGVHRGCYFSLLRGGCEDSEKVVGVDAFFERLGVPLIEKWRNHAKDIIKNNVSMIWGDAINVELLAGLTTQVSKDELKGFSPNGYRFISIDAGHDADSVFHDLCLSESLLSEQGVIAVDDFFNPLTPGVSEGFFCWMLNAGGSQKFSVAAYCGNKAFVVRKKYHNHYFKFLKKLVLDDEYSDLLQAGKNIFHRNIENGYIPIFLGEEYLCMTGR